MDRIYEAYIGKMGTSFQKKTQKRIEWILENVKGSSALEVGCSQGIVSLLIGEKGLSVVGIDINEEAIEYANNLLATQIKNKNNSVQFVCEDFLGYIPDRSYDTVVFGEVLEHILNPELFIEKAYSFMNENGSIVITVPFGINDDPDHVQTFYYSGIYQLISKYFEVETVKIFDKWIGFAGKKKTSVTEITDKAYRAFAEVEQAFFRIERSLIDSNIKKNEVTQELLEKLKKAQANYETAKSWHETEKSKSALLSANNEALLDKLQRAQANYETAKSWHETEKSKSALLSANNEALLDKLQRAQANYETAKGWHEAEKSRTALLSANNKDLTEKLHKAEEKYQTIKGWHETEKLKTSSLLAQNSVFAENLQKAEENLKAAKAQNSELLIKLEEIIKSQNDTLKLAEDNKNNAYRQKKRADELSRKLSAAIDVTRGCLDIGMNEDLSDALSKHFASYIEEKSAASDLILRLIKQEEESAEIIEMFIQQTNKLQISAGKLREENRVYKEKLDKITGVWYGRLGIKIYKLCKKVRNKIKNLIKRLK